MTYWKMFETLGGDSYDYDEGVDSGPRDSEEWCDWNDVDVEEGYDDPFRPDVGEGFVSAGTAFGMDTDTVVVASVVCEALADVRRHVSPADLHWYG